MRITRVVAGTVLGVAVVLAPTFCAAQTTPLITSPSQVTPPSLRPPTDQRGQGIPLTGDTALQAPAGAEKLNVIVGEVRIDGAFAELDGVTAPLIDEIKGQRVSVAKIYAAAHAIERLYAAAGYPLARVVVPPQKLVDHGPLLLVVIDGFVEDVDVTGVPERVRAVVAARTGALIGRRRVRQAEIEQALLIAGDVPGLRLKSTLMPGQSNGGTRLVLEGDHHLVTGSVGGDDRLARSLGTWQLRGSVAVNSLFGAGEQIYGTAGLGTDIDAAVKGAAPLALYGGGAVIPIGPDGITVNPEYTHSTTRTAALLGVPASQGTFERFALRLRDPVIRTRSESLGLNAAVEAVSQQVRAPTFDVTLSNDRYVVLRTGPDYTRALPWGATLLAAGSLSQGLGGRSGNDAAQSGVPLSHIGAGPDFTKVNGTLSLSQPLPGELRLDTIGVGQTSFGKPMFLSEQLALDGSNQVSAFAAGTINVDQGATLRGELVRPFAVEAASTSATVAPYLFGAVGHGHVFDTTVVEAASINVGALGFGARSRVHQASGAPDLNLTLELARQYTNIPGLRQGWRGNLNAWLEF